jgi:glyoxylase-like metal-dependent hydrolase (beta-lactamase superfamily II)
MNEQPDLDWFDVTQYDDGVVAIAEPGHVEDVKAYLVLGSERSQMVDSGLGFANIRAVVNQYTDRLVTLVNTHGHLDHIGNNWRFEHRWVHEGELQRVRAGVSHEQLSRFLTPESFSRTPPTGLDLSTYFTPGAEVEGTVDDGDMFDLGNRSLRVIHTPGHTPGCIALFDVDAGALLCGDIVHEGAMFAHYPGGSAHEYRTSVQKLATLISDLKTIYPGHSRYPIEPQVLLDVADAFDSIWNGREPDEHSGGLMQFKFEPFSLTLRDTWRSEIPGQRA